MRPFLGAVTYGCKVNFKTVTLMVCVPVGISILLHVIVIISPAFSLLFQGYNCHLSKQPLLEGFYQLLSANPDFEHILNRAVAQRLILVDWGIKKVLLTQSRRLIG